MKGSFFHDPVPHAPRILFIANAASTHTHGWIDLLESLPFNVRLFALPQGVPPSTWPVKTYVTASADVSDSLSRWNWRRSPGFRLRKHIDPRFEISRELKRLLRAQILSWKPQIVHTLGLEPASFLFDDLVTTLRMKVNFRWIVTVRGGPELSLGRLDANLLPRITSVFRSCDYLVADNQSNYRYAMELGLSSRKVSTLAAIPGGGGVDVETLRSLRKSAPSQQRSIVWPKAYDCPASKAMPVIEAIEKVHTQIQPFQLIMTALTSEIRQHCQSLAKSLQQKLELHDRIPREDLLKRLGNARVCLLPSLHDGIPNTLFEAMATGAFPIVSPIETIVPIVSAPRNVLFAQNLSVDEIAEAIKAAMRDDHMVDQAAQHNLELVSSLADRKRLRDSVTKFYRELL